MDDRCETEFNTTAHCFSYLTSALAIRRIEWLVMSATVCLSVCPHSKRKMAWAIKTRVGTHIPVLYGSHLPCIDREAKRSKVKVTQLQKASWSQCAAAVWDCMSYDCLGFQLPTKMILVSGSEFVDGVFEDLSTVDLLLQCTARDEAIDNDVHRLTDAKHSVHCLRVICRVPAWVDYSQSQCL